MNLIILGPQGSGKGTQAELLVQKFGFNYIEMGNFLRSIAHSDNEHAQIVTNFLSKGQLVPDEYVRLIAWDHINKQDKNKGFLFDGYPRSLAQYEQVQDMLRKFGKKIDWIIYLKIPEAESIRRLSARRTCEKCKEIYNLITEPSKNLKICDKCGGNLLIREDDTPEAIKRRLSIFHDSTLPILKQAESEGILLNIDGEQSVEKIHAEILEKLGL